MWLVWVTYFREHYDAGIIEVSYTDGTIGTVSGADSRRRDTRFHNELEVEQREESLSACIICHGDYPHAKSIEVRAYLNAHSYVMTCEVCHLESAEPAELTYRWLEDKTNSIWETRKGEERYKIVPIQYQDRLIKRFDEWENLDAIREYMDKQEEMNEAFKKAMIKETHVSVSQEAVECGDCHNIESTPIKLYYDLAYANDRIWELQRIEVAGMVRKYEDFYMPSLIRGSQEDQ
jgi:cytochrome c553